ncbi:MAG: hypothetical protein JJU12_08100 [Chlamydiales bacterium]|nr:hypothetical protein [Chlamydiales bacterium]
MQLIMRLQDLKKDYNACRSSKKNCAQLLQEREAIYDEIIRLKETVDMEVLKHKRPDRKFEKLANLKQKLQVIDHEIDEIGEDQDEKLGQLKKELVEAILKAFPEAEGSYQLLCQKLDAFRTEEKRSNTLLQRLQPFYVALLEGAAVKRSRGLLGILFGRNPKVLLARAIRKASIEAERVYKQIEDPRFRDFLSCFLKEANRPWNGSLYKERFYELHREFTQLVDEAELQNRQAKQEAIKTEEAIELWIEEYCRY